MVLLVGVLLIFLRLITTLSRLLNCLIVVENLKVLLLF